MALEGVKQGKEMVGEWSVVEKFGAPKDPSHGNEDGLYLGKNIAFVCDGVTSQTREKIDGLTPGQFAVRAALEALKSPEGQEITSQKIVPYLTKHVLGALASARISGKHIPGHPTFVFVAFFPKENKIVRVRDCQYLVDGKGENPGFPADKRKQQMFDRILASRRRGGHKDHKAELRQALREWQWKHRNNPKPSKYSYAAIDGTDVPENLVEYIDVPPEARDIVLTSDGYPPETLRNSLAETHERYREMLKASKDDDFNIDDLTYVRLRRDV